MKERSCAFGNVDGNDDVYDGNDDDDGDDDDNDKGKRWKEKVAPWQVGQDLRLKKQGCEGHLALHRHHCCHHLQVRPLSIPSLSDLMKNFHGHDKAVRGGGGLRSPHFQ